MPGVAINYNRTKCPICGARFGQGGGDFHYRDAHPDARWTSRWFKILVLLFVPAFITLLLIGDWLLPAIVRLMAFQEVLQFYIFGSMIIMLLYRFCVERSFRNAWNETAQLSMPSMSVPSLQCESKCF